ncbi:MAG: isocitrate lyase/PEP mutase family protein [Hyphomicrobiaceae bacterium]|nr:isocitrate lyase/PEP mutase family protein [Hyphomicrobiaceae bacterium]
MKRDSLRELIKGGRIVQVPGAFDSLSARLIERAGFESVYMTGFGATASRLGMPDIGLLTQTEMTEQARNMTRAVNIPVIADADAGYGGPSNVERTVREYVQAGVAAIHLEDQASPKRCGQMSGIRLVDPQEAVARIQVATLSRGNNDLIIIGRTDALSVSGMSGAIRRANMYLEAGADLAFVDGVKRIAEVRAISELVQGPKLVSIVDGTEAAELSVDDLQEMGFSIVLYAVTCLFSASRAMSDTLASLKANGSPKGMRGMSYDEFVEVVDLPFHQALGDRFDVGAEQQE